MRKRSPVSKVSDPSSSLHRERVALDDLVGGLDRVDALVQQPAGLEVEELAGDVGARQVEVVVALAPGQRPVQLTGLRVHEVRREGARVAPEQGVGQGAVAPVEARRVHPHQQGCECVQQPAGGVRAQRRGEERAIGQRELQVPGDQRRVERLAVVVDPAGEHAHCLDGGQVAALQLAQEAVLPQRDLLAHLLDGVHAPAEPDEAHDVARDAAGEDDELVLRPVLERQVPRQVEQRRVTGNRQQLQGHAAMVPDLLHPEDQSGPRPRDEGLTAACGCDQVGRRSPLSVENRWTWPCFGAKWTLSPFSGGLRPSTRAMMS